MSKNVTIVEKICWLCLSYVIFFLVYNFCGWYASNASSVDSFVFKFEYHIPFLPWMIIPYMSSGLFFALVFFLCSSKNELRLLTKRINFVTIVSGLFFILFPLKFTLTKPEVTNSFYNFCFQFLNKWDTIYNQAPSLHISYICIFWSVIRKNISGKWKLIIGIWLLLMGISTLTVFQHHLIDIIPALILICITFIIFSEKDKRNEHIGMVYFFFSSLSTLIALLIYHYFSNFGLLILWISTTLFLVGLAYLHSNAKFIKRANGTISIINKIIYFPYIIVYKIIWKYFRKNSKHPIIEILPQVFVGARLSSKDVIDLSIDASMTVIDLSAELEENKIIRKNCRYFSFPLLDIGAINQKEIEEILDLVSEKYTNIKLDEKIYIHCLMGYSRSIFIGVLFLKRQLNINIKEAIDIVKEKSPQVVLPEYLLNAT